MNQEKKERKKERMKGINKEEKVDEKIKPISTIKDYWEHLA